MIDRRGDWCVMLAEKRSDRPGQGTQRRGVERRRWTGAAARCSRRTQRPGSQHAQQTRGRVRRSVRRRARERGAQERLAAAALWAALDGRCESATRAQEGRRGPGAAPRAQRGAGFEEGGERARGRQQQQQQQRQLADEGGEGGALRRDARWWTRWSG
jgi:hypothetical protein